MSLSLGSFLTGNVLSISLAAFINWTREGTSVYKWFHLTPGIYWCWYFILWVLLAGAEAFQAGYQFYLVLSHVWGKLVALPATSRPRRMLKALALPAGISPCTTFPHSFIFGVEATRATSLLQLHPLGLCISNPSILPMHWLLCCILPADAAPYTEQILEAFSPHTRGADGWSHTLSFFGSCV